MVAVANDYKFWGFQYLVLCIDFGNSQYDYHLRLRNQTVIVDRVSNLNGTERGRANRGVDSSWLPFLGSLLLCETEEIRPKRSAGASSVASHCELPAPAKWNELYSNLFGSDTVSCIGTNPKRELQLI